jgi:hypothetical protein
MEREFNASTIWDEQKGVVEGFLLQTNHFPTPEVKKTRYV